MPHSRSFFLLPLSRVLRLSSPALLRASVPVALLRGSVLADLPWALALAVLYGVVPRPDLP